MFEMSVGNVGSVNVITTSNGGLSVEHWADRATSTIISVGDKSHPLISEQAEVFKGQIKEVISFYMKEAINSNKTTMIAELESKGYSEIADIIRSL
jgi:hypothetical protein|tara:strand:- start:132 stop:419 length:288 start_codon:yes stop_codon:yes gene_type:complete